MRRMKLFSALLDFNIFYVSLLFATGLFLLSVLDIYYDKKKNLWHLSGPFPLPFVGEILTIKLLRTDKIGWRKKRLQIRMIYLMTKSDLISLLVFHFLSISASWLTDWCLLSPCHTFLGNALLFAIPPEQIMPTMKDVSLFCYIRKLRCFTSWRLWTNTRLRSYESTWVLARMPSLQVPRVLRKFSPATNKSPR